MAARASTKDLTASRQSAHCSAGPAYETLYFNILSVDYFRHSFQTFFTMAFRAPTSVVDGLFTVVIVEYRGSVCSFDS